MDIRSLSGYGAWAVTYIRSILEAGFGWFSVIIGKLQMQWLWLGAVIFCIVFSVILMPLRGGAMLGGGLMSDVARSRIRNRRNSNKHLED